MLFLSTQAWADPLGDGVAAYEKKDYLKATQMFHPLAEKGDARAQRYLGYMHFHGKGMKEDDAKAFEWFSKAAAQGDSESQYKVGYMYTFGFGPKNESDPDLKAAEWYFKAAGQNHVEAQYSLGLMFLAGKGVVSSKDEAYKWIKRAADQGHDGAKESLKAFDKK
jgi:TPR repeat protein